MNKNNATILILDFLKAKQVIENVKSLNSQITDFKFKIIVIDNSCDKKNAEILSKLYTVENVELVINNKNLGYTKAHNSINYMLEGDYVLIVNPDIEWKDNNAIDRMIKHMNSNPKIGILGPKQIEKNGNIAMSVRAFPRFYIQTARRTILRNLPFLKAKVKYDEMQHLDYDKIQDVDWLQSSCVIIRRDLWHTIRGFNENYFLFMADVEICYQAWKRGYKVVYYPEAIIYADGKRLSTGGFKKVFKSWILRQHIKDSIKYRINHIFQKNPRFLNKK